jgi:uncharacterized membrane protein YidH (DUF202 family)
VATLHEQQTSKRGLRWRPSVWLVLGVILVVVVAAVILVLVYTGGGGGGGSGGY